MNGRIYDPTLGRFLQADPFIQAPSNSQSYNRYTYVWNNPLSYTDPSGYFVKSFLKGMMKVTGTGHILRALAKVPILNSAVQIAIGIGCGTAAAQCLAAYNGLQSYAVTGSLGAGLRTAAISYAQSWSLQQIGASKTWGEAGSIENVSANALVGGVAADLNGGKFGHGFVSAGVASAFKPLVNKIGDADTTMSLEKLEAYKPYRVVAAAAIGGTTSVISGGKFANGAITGAFVQMFNAETQNKYKMQQRVEKIGFVTNAPAWLIDKVGGDSSGFDLSLEFGVVFGESWDEFAGFYYTTGAGKGSSVSMGKTWFDNLNKIGASLVIGQSDGTFSDFSGQGTSVSFGAGYSFDVSLNDGGLGAWSAGFGPNIGLGVQRTNTVVFSPFNNTKHFDKTCTNIACGN